MTKAYQCDSCKQLFPGESPTGYPFPFMNHRARFAYSGDSRPGELCPLCLAQEMERSAAVIRMTADDWNAEANENAERALHVRSVEPEQGE